MKRPFPPFSGTGRPTDARACTRCGRVVGTFFNGTDRWQVAKHNRPDGRKCREAREAGTGRVIG